MGRSPEPGTRDPESWMGRSAARDGLRLCRALPRGAKRTRMRAMRLHRHAATRLLSLALLAASLLGGDCNSTDDTGSAGSAGSATSIDAVTKCTSLVDKLC